MATAFLCHSSCDKEQVQELAERLKSNGIDVWLDECELKIGDSIAEKVASAIHVSDFVIAVLSPNSVKSHWVQKELNLAITKEIETNRTVVFPVLLDKCNLPEYLRDKLYADFTNPTKLSVEFQKLVTAIKHLLSKIPASSNAFRNIPQPKLPETDHDLIKPPKAKQKPVPSSLTERQKPEIVNVGSYGEYGEGLCHCGGSLEHVGRGRGDHRILKCNKCGSVEWVY